MRQKINAHVSYLHRGKCSSAVWGTMTTWQTESINMAICMACEYPVSTGNTRACSDVCSSSCSCVFTPAGSGALLRTSDARTEALNRGCQHVRPQLTYVQTRRYVCTWLSRRMTRSRVTAMSMPMVSCRPPLCTRNSDGSGEYYHAQQNRDSTIPWWNIARSVLLPTPCIPSTPTTRNSLWSGCTISTLSPRKRRCSSISLVMAGAGAAVNEPLLQGGHYLPVLAAMTPVLPWLSERAADAVFEPVWPAVFDQSSQSSLVLSPVEGAGGSSWRCSGRRLELLSPGLNS